MSLSNNSLKSLAMGSSLIVVESPTISTSRLSNDLNGPRMLNLVNSAICVELNNVVLPERPIVNSEASMQQMYLFHNCWIKLINILWDEPTCTSNFCGCIDI